MKHSEYVRQREARDPAFKAAREALEPEFQFRRALIRARLDAGLTQEELAERIGTKQPAIARLESGSTRPSFETLQRLAVALEVTFAVTPAGVEALAYTPAM
jgi:transcriptional regulator with XRE-family HTH domain